MTPRLQHLWILLVLTGLAAATTYAPSTVDDRIRTAERVMCAECRSVEVRPDSSTGLLYTYSTFDLLEDLKGRSDTPTIRLRLIGGRLGDRATVVVGVPQFKRGTEYVLMLGKRNKAGYPTVVQFERGVLKMRRDARGRRFVEGAVGVGVRRAVSMPLDKFRTRVARVVREQEEARRKQAKRKGPKAGGGK